MSAGSTGCRRPQKSRAASQGGWSAPAGSALPVPRDHRAVCRRGAGRQQAASPEADTQDLRADAIASSGRCLLPPTPWARRRQALPRGPCGSPGDWGRPPALPQQRSLRSDCDRTKATTSVSCAYASTHSTSPPGPRLLPRCVFANLSDGGHAREDPDFNPYLETLQRQIFLQSLSKDLGKLSQMTRIPFSLCLVLVPA